MLSWPAISPPLSPATPSCSTPSTSSPRPSSPTRCRPRPCCGRWVSGWASAACPWGRRPPSSMPKPRRSWPPSGHQRPRAPRLAERGNKPKPKPVRIVFLGGLGEIGRNCACIEVEGRIIIPGCGIRFPDPDMPGIDLVLPEFTYLYDRKDRVDGIVLTHGHEDHTGGLAFLLREIQAPIYGSELTVGLARHRIEEAGLAGKTKFIPVADGETVKIGGVDVEFIPVTHSVPEAMAIAFHTPQGVILHSGDFKIDLQPVDGRRTDMSHIGALASSPGIRLLLSDSTNAEEPGFTLSESTVGHTLRRLFLARPGKRLIVACFASHIHRIQQIVDAAGASGRHVATIGRSMAKNIELAHGMGLLTFPDGMLVDIDDIDKLPVGELCVISTGSQGEPMS